MNLLLETVHEDGGPKQDVQWEQVLLCDKILEDVAIKSAVTLIIQNEWLLRLTP
jgi:hypothetical protein